MAAGHIYPEMAEIAEECKQEAYETFLKAEQEKRMGGLLVQRWRQ